MGTQRIHDIIAAELQNRIRRSPQYELPPVRQWTREYRVSNTTIGKAVRLLADRGLTRIGIPNLERRRVRWVAQRIRLIRGYAQARCPAVRAGAALVGNALWNMERPDNLHHFISTVGAGFMEEDDTASARGIHRGISPRRVILNKAAEFAAFLREYRPSAIIALNDFFARQFYYWFKAVGIGVPRACR